MSNGQLFDEHGGASGSHFSGYHGTTVCLSSGVQRWHARQYEGLPERMMLKLKKFEPPFISEYILQILRYKFHLIPHFLLLNYLIRPLIHIQFGKDLPDWCVPRCMGSAKSNVKETSICTTNVAWFSHSKHTQNNQH